MALHDADLPAVDDAKMKMVIRKMSAVRRHQAIAGVNYTCASDVQEKSDNQTIPTNASRLIEINNGFDF